MARLAALLCVLGTLCVALRVQAAEAAAEPVRQIALYVPPYYAAGASFGEPPTVAVDPAYDKLLASLAPADIRRVRDGVEADPAMVTPLTLIVLAIRLYDVGLRDDATFWYDVARDRYATMEAVLDMRSLRLLRVAETMDSFVASAGPTLDGYALCDLAHGQAQADKAIDWVSVHPYGLLQSPQLPAQDDNRAASLGAAIAQLRQNAAEARRYLSDPDQLAALQARRQQAQADARFCWK